MSDSMIERMAREIFKARWESSTIRGLARDWDTADKFDKGQAIGQARAAFESIREPTDAIKMAMFDQGQISLDAWRATIDAILKEKPES